MSNMRCGRAFLFMASLFVLLCCAPMAAIAVDAETITENLDNYFVPAFPDFYGLVVECFSESEMADINKVLKILEIVGLLRAAYDIDQRIQAGDYSRAALDAALNLAKLLAPKLADETTKRILLLGSSVAVFPVTLLVTTAQIALASKDALDRNTIGRELETFYSRVENDPILKNKGRKLGEGEPIRQDAAAVEHLWRKVYQDPEFQDLFRKYVTTVLSHTWPEPSTWETLTTSSDLLKEAKLIEHQRSLKKDLEGLLKELNEAAKARESTVLVSRMLRELAAAGEKLSEEELRKALEFYHYALLKLPEVREYLGAFPPKYEGLKANFDKATSTELEVIKKLIINEQTTISLYARAMRGLPVKGRQGSARSETLTGLKKAYGQLNQLYDSIPRSEINRRLEEQNKRILEEAARLDSGGVEFTFKRYECKKQFDDVKDRFYDKVLSGAPDAQGGVETAKRDIETHRNENRDKYAKDYEENQKKDKDTVSKLEEEIAKLAEAEKRASGEAAAALYKQRLKLQYQLIDLGKRYEKYQTMHGTTSMSDAEACDSAVVEIDKFYESNKNRFQIILASLFAQAASAKDIYFNFKRNHSVFHGSMNFVSAEEMARLRNMAAQAPPDYAGMDLSFLKNHIRMGKDKTVSLGIQETLKEMTEALSTYMRRVSALRMTYYSTYETSTLPSLKFMESKEAASAVNAVMDALNVAIGEFRKVEPRNIPQTSKAEYAETLANLGALRADMGDYQKLISMARGLSAIMEKYLAKAATQNASVEEDVSYLSSLWSRFNTTSSYVTGTFGMFRIRAAQWSPTHGTPPPILTREAIRNALEARDLLTVTEKTGLGLERLIPDKFFEVRTKEGFLTVRAENLNSLAGRVAGLPTSDLRTYFGGLYGIKDSGGLEGFIMDCHLNLGNPFWDTVTSDSSVGDTATKLKEVLSKQYALALRNQEVIDEARARFDIILNKTNTALSMVKGYMEGGKYESVLYYINYCDDLKREYAALTSTRQDVDNVLKELSGIIEQARTKMLQPGPPSPMPGQDASIIASIRDFYTRFKQAYESKNDSQVMGFIGDDWQSGDGTTLSDLQVNLNRSFKTFDEIRYNLQNIQINRRLEGIYNVSYDVTITSRIFKRNLKHEEKSSVTEEVVIDRSGKAKITKTLNGRFWYVK